VPISILEEVKLGASHEPLSPADVNLLRRADAAGQRLFRELVAKRIAWGMVGEVSRLIAVDVVAVSIPTPGCEHPRPCKQPRCLDQLEVKAVLGNRAARLPSLVLTHGAGVGGRVLETGRAYAVSDYPEAPFDDELIALATEEGIESLLAVPISFAGVVRGVLHAGLRRAGGFGSCVAEALSRVATYAGAALAAAGDRARVEELARLRERRRLARALHDDLGQQLFGVGVQARRARESATTGHPDLMSHLHELERQVVQASSALRQTMNGLAPQHAQSNSLAVVLSEDVAAFQQRTGLPSHLIVLDEPAPLEPGVADLLARVAREGLRNVERHSHASEVVVTLRVDAAAAELTVQDDGVGCRTGLRQGRLGLTTLRDEIARLRGELRLTSNDDVGATLRVSLPQT
jgi:signal transduction histidine kinase